MNKVSNVINRLSELSEIQVELKLDHNYQEIEQSINKSQSNLNQAKSKLGLLIAQTQKTAMEYKNEMGIAKGFIMSAIKWAEKNITTLKAQATELSDLPDALKAINAEIGRHETIKSKAETLLAQAQEAIDKANKL